jgi:hypothetical protein
VLAVTEYAIPFALGQTFSLPVIALVTGGIETVFVTGLPEQPELVSIT